MGHGGTSERGAEVQQHTRDENVEQHSRVEELQPHVLLTYAKISL